jgi:hypothetical protein
MTAEVPERLILDGEQCLLTTLLPLPQGHSRVIETSDEEFQRQKSREPDGGKLGSSACWRRQAYRDAAIRAQEEAIFLSPESAQVLTVINVRCFLI